MEETRAKSSSSFSVQLEPKQKFQNMSEMTKKALLHLNTNHQCGFIWKTGFVLVLPSQKQLSRTWVRGTTDESDHGKFQIKGNGKKRLRMLILGRKQRIMNVAKMKTGNCCSPSRQKNKDTRGHYGKSESKKTSERMHFFHIQAIITARNCIG